MLILGLAILVACVWLFVRRTGPVGPAVRRAAAGVAIACAGAVLALRGGLGAFALLAVAVAGLVVWLRLRGRGGDDPGDDGRDPPDEPDPSSDPGQRLDPDAFDRARARWEQELRERS